MNLKKAIKKLLGLSLALAIVISPLGVENYAFADDVENPIEFNWYDDIKDAAVESISNRAYTGSYIKPALNITYKNKTLVKNKDYTVSYKNNKSIGTATITVKGINSYKGTKTVTFKIVPKKVVNLKAKTSKSRVTLSYSKSPYVSGYQIYRATSSSGKYTKVGTTTKLSFTDKTTKKNKKYYYKVRAYKKKDSKTYYGSYSSVVSIKCK